MPHNDWRPKDWDLTDEGLSWKEMYLSDLFRGRWTRHKRLMHRLGATEYMKRLHATHHKS